MSFTKQQVEKLKSPLSTEIVKTRKGTGSQKLSYIAGYDVINQANEIFGFDGWNSEVVSIELLEKTSYRKAGYQGKPDTEMVAVAYSCRVKVSVGSQHHEGIGFGNGSGNTSTAHGLHSAYELAMKESETDAMKRAFRKFGNQFANTLYDKDTPDVASRESIEMGKMINGDEFNNLFSAANKKGLSKEWIIEFLKAGGYTGDLKLGLRTDWFDYAEKGVNDAPPLKAQAEKDYKDSYDSDIRLMKTAASLAMLRAVAGRIGIKAKELGKSDDVEAITVLYKKIVSKKFKGEK